MASICIFGIAVCKFCRRQEFCLVILLFVDKCLEIGFYCAVLPLILAIYLRLKGGREVLIDVEEIA